MVGWGGVEEPVDHPAVVLEGRSQADMARE